MLKNIVLTLFSIANCIYVFAQAPLTDTVIELNPVTISASRVSIFALGQGLVIADSLDLSDSPGGNLGDAISGMTSIHLKNYGSGTLTTLSVRGTSSNQTGLLWNGIRISPPNIGYVDLSMLRTDFFDDISLLYGGASPMFGSGSIGGSLHLDNQPEFTGGKSSLKIGGSLGSFRRSDARADFSCSGKNLYSRSAAFYSQSANNYPYSDLHGQKQSMEHGGYSAFGALQQFGARVAQGQTLQAIAWFQYADRNIPPTLTESESAANQVDRSMRVMLSWKAINQGNVLEAKAAYFNEFERYTDPRAQVYSTIETQTATAQFESTWSVFSASSIFGGANYIFDYADLSTYGTSRQESTLAFFATFLQPIDAISWKVALHLRQEFLSAYHSPFLFGLSAEGKLKGPLSAAISFSRNFRAPTMNERFWIPGGNAALSPEKSWNAEMSFIYRKLGHPSVLDFRLTAFTSFVNDWILWVPGANYWSAENVRQVWARGLEVSGEQDLAIGRLRLVVREAYTLSLSTNENQVGPNDAAYRKQLIYIPVHQALLKTFLGWKGYGLTIRQTVSGLVYTSSDNSTFLPAYYLLDLVLGKTWSIKGKMPVSLIVNANNILNKNYQVTPYRPMPGVNFLISLNLNINNLRK